MVSLTVFFFVMFYRLGDFVLCLTDEPTVKNIKIEVKKIWWIVFILPSLNHLNDFSRHSSYVNHPYIFNLCGSLHFQLIS